MCSFVQVLTDKNPFVDKNTNVFGRTVLNISNQMNLIKFTGTEISFAVGIMPFAKRVVFSSVNSSAVLGSVPHRHPENQSLI